MTIWRTTKIPEYYFEEIERVLNLSSRYISVSEFIRKAIEEKLLYARRDRDFLLFKDLIFNEAKIKEIHALIAQIFKMDSKKILRETIKQIIESSLDIDLITFLAKFMKNFAESHPFEEGNKRTLLITVDSFLRLNNLKLKLNAKKEQETSDEIFFWQNSNHQKTIEQIKSFISKHLEEHLSTYNIDSEVKQSIKDNKLMLGRLSR